MKKVFGALFCLSAIAMSNVAYSSVGILTTDESIIPVISKLAESFAIATGTDVSVKYENEDGALQYIKNGGSAFFVISANKSTCERFTSEGLANVSYTRTIFKDSFASFGIGKTSDTHTKLFFFPLAESLQVYPKSDENIVISKSDDEFDIITQNLLDGSIGIARFSHIAKYRKIKMIDSNIQDVPYFICEIISNTPMEAAKFEKFIQSKGAQSVILKNFYKLP